MFTSLQIPALAQMSHDDDSRDFRLMVALMEQRAACRVTYNKVRDTVAEFRHIPAFWNKPQF